MSEEEIKQLAEEISFRLLATRKHPEHEWLIKRLDKVINEKPGGGTKGVHALNG